MIRKFFVKIFLLIFISNNCYASDFSKNIGDQITTVFNIDRTTNIDLPKGNWKVIEKDIGSLSAFIWKEMGMVLTDGNKLIAGIEIGELSGLTKYQGQVMPIIEAAVFKPKEGGCIERQHYSFLRYYKKGFNHNCVAVYHLDVQRELYGSDYDPDRVYSALLRKWIKKNEIQIPNIMLVSESSFLSFRVRDRWVVFVIYISPEYFDNFKPQFTQRDTSEFHPDRINRFPEAKQVIEKFINYAANIHENFQDQLSKSNKSLKIDLSEFIGIQVNPISNNNIADEIEKLNSLYKKGIISKEEFEKAKSKILN